MARRGRKSSYTQKVVGLATVGMPAPVQKVATSRWGSRLLIVAVPLLIFTGVLTVSWTGLLPSFSINGQRAAVVGEQVKTEAIKAAERVRQYGGNSYR
jgi:hypothetical protein